MNSISLVLLSAGNSSRFGLPTKKQWLYIDDKPLWLFVADSFKQFYNFAQIVIVGSSDEIKLMSKFVNFKIVEGGNTRQESLVNALKYIDSDYVLVSDVARVCINKNLIDRVISNKKEGACVVPTLKVSDTVYYDNKPIDRDKLLKIQTPQLSHTKTLKEILNTTKEFTDESSAFYQHGKEVIFVEGNKDATKLTYKEDLKTLPCLKPPINLPKVGIGLDIHPFEDGKKMLLGGVKINSLFGFKAHSDGDVAIHALIDALLGASSLGDIGELFPDSDQKYKDADSKELLKIVAKLVKGVGYEIIHCDLTILAQVPKISPYKDKMVESLSSILEIEKAKINIKATTAENLGFVGRKEGVAVKAVVTLNYYRWDRI